MNFFTECERVSVEKIRALARSNARYYVHEFATNEDLDSAVIAALWEALEQEAFAQGVAMSVLIGGNHE